MKKQQRDSYGRKLSTRAYVESEAAERHAMKLRMEKQKVDRQSGAFIGQPKPPPTESPRKKRERLAAMEGRAKAGRKRRSTTGENAGTMGGARKIDPRAFFGRGR